MLLYVFTTCWLLLVSRRNRQDSNSFDYDRAAAATPTADESMHSGYDADKEDADESLLDFDG